MVIKAQALTDLIASSVSSAYWKPGMEPIRRVYNLNGFTFGVAAGDEQLASFLDPILAPLACPPTASCDWIVELSPVAVIDVPTDARRIFEGPLPEGLTCAMVEDGDGRKLIVPGHFAMWFRRAARRTDLSFVPGKEDGLGGTAAFWMLDDLLAAHGRFLLHGGLVVDPKSESSIAIFAPSGTGKTTTVLALAHAGFCLAGDDALVLDVGEDGCGMWAVPRKLKVHRKTAALLPWLDPLLTGNWIDNEQALEIGALQPVVSCALPRRRRVGLVVAQPKRSRHHPYCEARCLDVDRLRQSADRAGWCRCGQRSCARGPRLACGKDAGGCLERRAEPRIAHAQTHRMAVTFVPHGPQGGAIVRISQVSIRRRRPSQTGFRRRRTRWSAKSISMVQVPTLGGWLDGGPRCRAILVTGYSRPSTAICNGPVLPNVEHNQETRVDVISGVSVISSLVGRR